MQQNGLSIARKMQGQNKMTELTFTECSTEKQPDRTINSYSVYLTARVVPERGNLCRARAVTGRGAPPTKGRGEEPSPEEASERNQRKQPHKRWSEQHPTKATPKRCPRAALTLGRKVETKPPQQPKPTEVGENEGGEIDTAHGEAGQHRGRAIAPTPTHCTLRYEVCNTAT